MVATTLAVYSPDEVEEKIDEARGGGQWAQVLELVEVYLHLFDVGTAQSSRQHETALEIKGYYWSVLAEAVFEGSSRPAESPVAAAGGGNNRVGSIARAVECAHKSIELNPEYGDARILLCRMLLSICAPFLHRISPHSEGNEESRPAGGFTMASDPLPPCTFPSFDVDVPPFVAKEVFADVFSCDLQQLQKYQQPGIPPSDQTLLLGVLDVAPAACCNMLLAILDALSVPDQLYICHQVLAFTRCAPNRRPTTLVLFATWVLVTARLLLSAVRLDIIVDRLADDSITPYRLWLHFDAVACRGTISELLGDLLQARNDIIQIVRYGTLVPLPGSALGTVSAALGRLPLLEGSGAMLQEALASFDRCLRAAEGLALPIPVLLGIKVRIALQLLERAKAGSAAFRSPASSPGSGRVNSSPSVVADINKASVLLTSVRSDMSTPITPQFAARLSLAPLEPQAKSMLNLLPRPSSDPRNVSGLANSRTVSSTLAAAMFWQSPLPPGPEGSISPFSAHFLFQEQPDSDRARTAAAVVRVAGWGCRLEVNPGPDLVYVVARALLESGNVRVDAITSLLQQSHRLQLQEHDHHFSSPGTGPAGAAAASLWGQKPTSNPLKLLTQSIAPLLRWLGLYSVPSDKPWLPAIALAELGLEHGDEMAALVELRGHIVDLYGQTGLDVLVALGSDSAEASASALNSICFDPSAPNYSLLERFSRFSDAAAALASIESPELGPEVDWSEDESAGVLELVARLGLLHAAVGRWGGVQGPGNSMTRQEHLLAALRCSNVVLRVASATAESVSSDVSAAALALQPEVQLQRCLLLAELAKFEEASTELQAALNKSLAPSSPRNGEICTHVIVRLTLLQALLQAHAAQDDPTELGSAVGICQRALAQERPVTLPHACALMALAQLKWSAGEREGAARAALGVLDYFRVTENQRRTAIELDLQERRRNRASSDEGVTDAPSREALQNSGMSRPSGVLGLPPSTGLGVARLSRQSRRKAVNLLVSAGRLLRVCGQLQEASLCLQEAWVILFTAADLSNLSMAEDETEPEHTRRELLAHLPTLLGWRLPECSGWCVAAPTPEAEATVLVEAGKLALARALGDSSVGPAEASARAEKLYRFALATCPRHCPALVALAELELAKGHGAGLSAASLASIVASGGAVPVPRDLNPFEAIVAARDEAEATAANQDSRSIPRSDQSLSVTLGELGPVSRGHEMALLAVRVAELDASAWEVYGKSLLMSKQPHGATEALLTSLEVDSIAGIGPFVVSIVG